MIDLHIHAITVHRDDLISKLSEITEKSGIIQHIVPTRLQRTLMIESSTFPEGFIIFEYMVIYTTENKDS